MNRSRIPFEKYQYHEVALSGKHLASEQKKKAQDIFSQCGIPFQKLALTDYKNHFQICYYTRSDSETRRLQKCFQKYRIKGVRLKIRILYRHDWFDKWKRDYHMRPLGKKFMIVPVWEKEKFNDPGRIPIYLEPGSAFGSGYHETTRLMARLLEWRKGSVTEFLDVGTGTGILSVVAAKQGASRVVAFDNDKPSVMAARHNFELNGCAGGKFFVANLTRLKLQKRFNLVGANLISKVLVKCRSKILSTVKPGGILLVCGIMKENLSDFRNGFRGPELKCLKMMRGRKWCALAFRKAE